MVASTTRGSRPPPAERWTDRAGQRGAKVAWIDIDRAGFVVRQADVTDRRRTIVGFTPTKEAEIKAWLDDAAAPLSRVLDQLTVAEQAAFLKAMDLLEAELHPPATS